jgi:hypothetical protein
MNPMFRMTIDGSDDFIMPLCKIVALEKIDYDPEDEDEILGYDEDAWDGKRNQNLSEGDEPWLVLIHDGTMRPFVWAFSDQDERDQAFDQLTHQLSAWYEKPGR